MKPSRNLWPLGIIAAFGVFVAGTAGLVILACSQKVDLVSRDYYEEEIRYQNRIDSVDRAHRLASPARVAYDQVHQEIDLALPAEHVLAKPTGRIQLYRPSSAALDEEWTLKLDEHGRQRLDAKRLRPGPWKVRVLWDVGAQEYSIEQSVIIEGSRSRPK